MHSRLCYLVLDQIGSPLNQERLSRLLEDSLDSWRLTAQLDRENYIRDAHPSGLKSSNICIRSHPAKLKMARLNRILTLSAMASASIAQALPVSTREAMEVVDMFRVIEQSYSRGTLIADAQSFDGSLLGALNLEQQVDIVTVSMPT